jgi:hypothetical protein
VLRGRTEKIFVLVILLLAGLSDVSLAVVTASDTLSAACNSLGQSEVFASSVNPSNEHDSSFNSSLADIGVELLKAPSADAAGKTVAIIVGSTSTYKLMPAVPTALLMVLTGFLSISLIKDRKVWLAAFVGMVYLGQIGITALPKVAENVKNAFKAHEISALLSHNGSQQDSGFRVRSEVEGTAYIGLLRKLSGIGDVSGGSTFNTRSTTDIVCDFVNSTQSNLKYGVSTYAAYISSLFCSEALSSCPVRSTGQFLAFSPAFLISNLPHGPPEISLQGFFFESKVRFFNGSKVK